MHILLYYYILTSLLIELEQSFLVDTYIMQKGTFYILLHNVTGQFSKVWCSFRDYLKQSRKQVLVLQ